MFMKLFGEDRTQQWVNTDGVYYLPSMKEQRSPQSVELVRDFR
jgi:hypothetical protein